VTDPQSKVFDLLFGRWRSQILYAGVKLGIFDILREEPKEAASIAQELGLDPHLSYRLLRALGSLELLRETEHRRFSLTDAGQLLRSDHPTTLRGIAVLTEGSEHYALWKHLGDMVRDGRQNAFVREFRQMAFDYAAEHPEYARAFDEAMSNHSYLQTDWTLEALKTYDFSKISHICDVGGGQGHLLCSILSKYPLLKGTVLERASVIANRQQLWAIKSNVGGRCEYVAGDMFERIPKADAYLMKMILHDWSDDECARILANIRCAAANASRVFIVEHIIPGPETSHFSKLYDIQMMCWGTGRERTLDEYVGLLRKGGWTYLQTWYPASGMIGVIEGTSA
jgi:O-methyltransferase domain/Dimerisation domain